MPEETSSGSSYNNSTQVRSSSRIGHLDYGVNAKRINYFAQCGEKMVGML